MIGMILIARAKNYIQTTKIILITLLVSLSAALYFTISSTQASPKSTVSNWWPSNNVSISGVQPFKGALSGWNVNDYSMYWSVSGGQTTVMPTVTDGYAHKEASVNVDTWNWEDSGNYSLSFIAKSNSGEEIARTTFSVHVVPVSSQTPVVSSGTNPVTVAPTTSVVAAVTTKDSTVQTSPSPVTSSNPILNLYINPYTSAKQQADSWRVSRPSDAAQLDKIANQPQAKWFGDWNPNISTDVSSYVSAAAAQAALPVLVAYNIPQRDCGGYSAGGTSADNYLSWIRGFAAGIGARPALVIIEPDAIANIDCLSVADQTTRLSLLSQAVSTLKSNPNTHVYLDGGNARWKPSDVIGGRLNKANIGAADGFSLNVSNFYTTGESASYGQAVSNLVGGKHFVIDTSRNGLGAAADGQWCNPDGRALGERPSLQTGKNLVDAYLWIKAPGESDGTCNDGPSAGGWWADYALHLAQRAAY